MTLPIAPPPMAYRTEGDRSRYLQPSVISSKDHRSSNNSNTLGQQIYDAYDYRAQASPRYKDPEAMSDTTSATYSRSPSAHEIQYNKMYSPTFSQVSRAEEGRGEYTNGGGHSHNGNGETYLTSPFSPRDPTRASGGPVFTYTPPKADPDKFRDHAVWILFWLAVLDPLYSLVGAVYAMVTLLVLILLAPLRFFGSSCSLKNSIIRFLSPFMKKHLRLMYAEFDKSRECRASMLAVISILAPFASFGVAIAAWISASFWIFALIMGNPDGTERGDDGRNTVLAVRNWWAKCLTKALQ